MDRESIVAKIKRVAVEKGLAQLTQQEFCKESGIPTSAIKKHFDRWSEACAAAGISSNQYRFTGNPGPTRQECLDDIVRVANILGTTTLTQTEYKKHGKWPGLRPAYRHFGDWASALDAAGLSRPINGQVSFDTLAAEFVQVAEALGRMPTLQELTRRTRSTADHFAGRCGGYAKYKIAVADWFCSRSATDRPKLSGEALAALLAIQSPQGLSGQQDPAPHRVGSVLRFRQFAYAPTQEQDVVAIFNSVAEDLGFEIIANRVKFPDCLARERQPGSRSHYFECRIEFEFKSSDYRAHGHPLDGCDLIVCWKHDWEGSPIRVLELSTRIRRLKGWR